MLCPRSVSPHRSLLLLAWGSILALLLSGAAFAFPSPAVISSPAARMIGHGRNTVVVSAITAMPMPMRMSDSDGGPAVSDRPAETKEVVKDNDVDDKEEVDERTSSGGYEIRLLNDPFNKREFVARCLNTVCGKSDSESYEIMMEAHSNGMGVVGRYMFEIAELYYTRLQEAGLLVQIVPMGDD